MKFILYIIGLIVFVFCLLFGAGCRHMWPGIDKHIATPPEPPSFTSSRAVVNPPRYYVAVTALDTSGLESSYSNEVGITNLSAVLAWNASPSTNVAGYRLWWGTNSVVYTKAVNVGNVLTASIVPQDRIVTITSLYATNLNGTWTQEPRWPPLVWTNPVGNLYYKNRVTITNR